MTGREVTEVEVATGSTQVLGEGVAALAATSGGGLLGLFSTAGGSAFAPLEIVGDRLLAGELVPVADGARLGGPLAALPCPSN